MIKFTIPLKPFGKQSVRVFRNHAFLPKETRNYMNSVTSYFKQQFPDYKPSPVALKMTITSLFGIPKYLSAGKHPKIDSMPYPLKKPDLSNIAKIIEDGLNGYAIYDDAYIVESVLKKAWAYDNNPRIEVTIEEC